MEIKIQAPSHVCPECGEWWVVEPVAQDKWTVVRYGDHTNTWCEATPIPLCPDCLDIALDLWLVDDR